MSYKKSGRTGFVVEGGTYIPPRQPESSGDCGGDITSPPKQSPSQPPQPQPAAGADGSVTGRAGDLTVSPSPPGSARQKGKRPGKAKKSLSTGATPKKGRVGKRDSTTGPAPSIPGQPAGHAQPEGVPLHGSVHPGLGTGHAQPEKLPLHGSVHPAPHSAHASTAVPRDGLLYRRPDQAACAIGLGAMAVAKEIGNGVQTPWGPVGTLRSEGSPSTSGFTRCSGIPAPQPTSDTTTESARGRPSKKGKKARPRSPSSSGSTSGRPHRDKRHKGGDPISREEFLEAFHTLAASITGRREGGGQGPSDLATEPVPHSQHGHGWLAPGQRGLPHTASRAPDSPPGLPQPPSNSYVQGRVATTQWGPPQGGPPCISLHPSAAFESDHGRRDDASSESRSSMTSCPSDSADSANEEDELVTSIQRLSVSETELRLVQRDMIRVMNLPCEPEPPSDERQSFKKRAGPATGAAKPFPVMPLDRVCSDRMDGVMGTKKWTPYSKRTEPYYRFPPADFQKYFATPVLPDSASDKLIADRGSSSSKLPFADKIRGKLEDVARKMDSSARMGMRTTSFLLLLSEYLEQGCDEENMVPADMMIAALHCLDNGLCSILDQFTKITTLATTSRRANVLDALFLPSAGARKRLDDLPLTGVDLFSGQFQTSMEAEAKRLKATDKINLKKPNAPPKAVGNKAKKQPSFVIPRRRQQKATRGSFRGRADNTAGARYPQTQPGQPRTQSGRGFRAPAPRYTGAWRK